MPAGLSCWDAVHGVAVLSAGLAALPLLALVLTTHLAAGRLGHWRPAVLVAALATATYAVFSAELLGALQQLTREGAIAVWGVAVLGLAAVVARSPRRSPPRPPRPSGWLWAVLGICAVTLLAALVCPPNNWDSMAYHLPRVMHWQQQASLAHYPANDVRQLYQYPGAEYLLLHLHLLSGTDWFDNLVQWLAMVGSLVGVSLIASAMGGDARSQGLAALVAASVPMGVIQASSSMNDYVTALWLVCLVWQAAELWRRPAGKGPLRVLGIGVALGLALVTKGTAWLLVPPIGLWVAVSAWRRWGMGFAPRMLVVLAIAALFVAPHLWRNQQAFGSTQGPETGKYFNASLWPNAVASNLIRHAVSHLGTPSRSANAGIRSAVDGVHRLLGISSNDRRTTFPGRDYEILRFSKSQERAGNPLHVLLLAVSVASVLASRRLRANRLLLAAALCVAAMVLLFAGALRWQPWGNRLQLPIFVIGSALAGMVLATWRTRVATAVALLLVAGATPVLFKGRSRPILGSENIFNTPREELYFRSLSRSYDEYRAVADWVASRGAEHVGLALHYNVHEYQLWVLLADEGVRLHHVMVGNDSARLRDAPPVPVVVTSRDLPGRLLPHGKQPREGPVGYVLGVLPRE